MLQESPDQRKQGGGEGDPALFVYWHVHPGRKHAIPPQVLCWPQTIVVIFKTKKNFRTKSILSCLLSSPDEPLVSHFIGALLAKAERGVNVL